MKEKMIKVLHVVSALGDADGIANLLLEYYRQFDREIVHFDFAIFAKEVGRTGREFEKMGSKFYNIPLKSRNFHEYVQRIREILEQGKYDIIHVHENETSYVALGTAKKTGVKCRIAHAHGAAGFTTINNEVRRISGVMFNNLEATHLMACGIKAGERCYGKNAMKKGKVIVLNNAVDTEKFKYNMEKRQKLRGQLGIGDNALALVNVSRLSKEKNLKFSIDIFEKMNSNGIHAKFFLVGDGIMENELKEYVASKNLDDKVMILGARDDVPDFLQAMDIFLMTSLHEGFPVAVVEAQAAGLPCVISDAIPPECKITNLVSQVSLKSDLQVWVDEILRAAKIERRITTDEIRDAGYDIAKNAKWLQDFYIENSKL